MLQPGDQLPGCTSASEGSRTETVSELFHRLNNQLGIILANAELLEAKAMDEAGRRRSGHVIASVLDAMMTARDIRSRVDVPPEHGES